MKSFKLFSILPIIGVLLFFISCATGPGPAISPDPIKLDITVIQKDGTPADIEACNKDDEEEILTADEREGQGLGSLSAVSWLNDARTKAFIKIFSGLSIHDVTRLWNDITFLNENTDIRDIQLYINSPGGDAFSGLALADQIEKAKALGFTVTAHASGIIASAAVPVLAVCNKRYAAEGTIFMVHEAAIWKWPGRETASDIQSQNDLMQLLRERYIGKLVDNTKLNKDEWRELEKKTTWFSTKQAREWGLVDPDPKPLE